LNGKTITAARLTTIGYENAKKGTRMNSEGLDQWTKILTDEEIEEKEWLASDLGRLIETICRATADENVLGPQNRVDRYHDPNYGPCPACIEYPEFLKLIGPYSEHQQSLSLLSYWFAVKLWNGEHDYCLLVPPADRAPAEQAAPWLALLWMLRPERQPPRPLSREEKEEEWELIKERRPTDDDLDLATV
jgi:hypothetical protein